MTIFSLRHDLYRQAEMMFFRLRVARFKRSQVRIEFGGDLQLFGLPRLQLRQNTELRIGSQCIFRSKPESNPIGVDQPVTFCTLSATAKIIVGDRVGISGGSFCARQLIEIGDGTLIGANVYIFDNDFHSIDPTERMDEDYLSVRSAPVRIGSNVFIGTRSVILKGVTIGDNAIIGAGSVVTQSIPSNATAGGNPCRVRGQSKVEDDS